MTSGGELILVGNPGISSNTVPSVTCGWSIGLLYMNCLKNFSQAIGQSRRYEDSNKGAGCCHVYVGIVEEAAGRQSWCLQRSNNIRTSAGDHRQLTRRVIVSSFWSSVWDSWEIQTAIMILRALLRTISLPVPEGRTMWGALPWMLTFIIPSWQGRSDWPFRF